MKFKNIKVGDRLYHLLWGWGTVIKINKDDEYPIHFKSDMNVVYTTVDYDGRIEKKHKNPILFWNEIKLSMEEDKQPFNLVEFLKKNLEPKEFESGSDNYCLVWNYKNSRIDYENEYWSKVIGITYFKNISPDTRLILNKNKITPEQLNQALKELGWV